LIQEDWGELKTLAVMRQMVIAQKTLAVMRQMVIAQLLLLAAG